VGVEQRPDKTALTTPWEKRQEIKVGAGAYHQGDMLLVGTMAHAPAIGSHSSGDLTKV